MSAVDSNVADLIDAIGTARPQGPAIHLPHRGTLSFGALAAQLRYVRGRLQAWEFRPGDVVAGYSVLRPQMAVTIATLPSACTFAPLAPTLSRELHVETLERLRARAVVVDAGGGHALRAAADELGIGVLEIVADAAAGPGLFELKRCRAAARAPAPSHTSAEHCYVISTSGTSGRRKLVPIRHRVNILVARATADRLALGHDDIGVHLMPMHFGHGVHSALMSALLAGRSIVCLPEADIPALFDAIGEFGPTYLSAGFSIFQEIARRAAEFPDALAHSRVRFMRSGSGHLARTAAERLEQAFSAPMLNGLSSTETGFIALDPFPSGQRKRGAAGLPLLNDVAIFDPNGQAVPAGTQGEIVTRGPTLFEGYLDDPKLTAASFVGDWYCTGDLGSIDEDGYLHLHGRLREVINRGGEKISPVECGNCSAIPRRWREWHGRSRPRDGKLWRRRRSSGDAARPRRRSCRGATTARRCRDGGVGPSSRRCRWRSSAFGSWRAWSLTDRRTTSRRRTTLPARSTSTRCSEACRP